MTPRLPVANYTITHHDETCWEYQKLNHWTVFAFVFKVKVIVAYKFYIFFKHFQPLKRFLQLYPSSWFQPISKIVVNLDHLPQGSGWDYAKVANLTTLSSATFFGRETSLEPIGTWNFVEENQPTPQRIHRSRSLRAPMSRVDPWVSRFKPQTKGQRWRRFLENRGVFLDTEKKLPLV